MANILLIDDDADLTRFLQINLEQSGHRVTCLERAESGPDTLAGGDFDLVLLDNKMPGMSGIDFLAALQQRGKEIDAGHRSEEHTSELQSPYDLVCRLLLEKKMRQRLDVDPA